jgi:membrane-bound lytic murein transglycosylase B
MQFMPGTWKAYGLDASGDGKADPYDPKDAIFSAANYLRASGATSNLAGAVYAYNHSQRYVQTVLQLAEAYANGTSDVPAGVDTIARDPGQTAFSPVALW